jgi:predicted  nucleic acid-binding Zn-ribbon protein
MEAETRSAPTTDDLVEHVREGVEVNVRDALAEAERLRSEADEKLAHYDGITSELAQLRLELHGLRHEVEGIPDRLAKARLDSLVYGVGEDPNLLERRYVAVRERLPVAESRIARLESELASLVSGGSRPAKVRNERHLLKHKGREPVLDALQEAAKAVEALREELPDVVEKASEDLIRERNTTRDGQNSLWGQAKA